MIQTQLIPQSPSELTSPSPFSPFSTASLPDSELATSDEAPDLGAFANVFREFNDLHVGGPPLLVPRTGLDATPSSSIFALPSGSESEASSRVFFAHRVHGSHAYAATTAAGRGDSPASRARTHPAREHSLHSSSRTAGNTPARSPPPGASLSPSSLTRRAHNDSSVNLHHGHSSHHHHHRPYPNLPYGLPGHLAHFVNHHRLSNDARAHTDTPNSYFAGPDHLSDSSLSDVPFISVVPPRRKDGRTPSGLDSLLGHSLPVPFSRSQPDLLSPALLKEVDLASGTETGTEDVLVGTEDDEGIYSGDRSPSVDSPEDENDGDDAEPTLFNMDDVDITLSGEDAPTLGDLEEAFKFIAAERERIAALRAAAATASSSLLSVTDAAKKRNRRRKRSELTSDAPPTSAGVPGEGGAEGDESAFESPDAAGGEVTTTTTTNSSMDAQSAKDAVAFLRAKQALAKKRAKQEEAKRQAAAAQPPPPPTTAAAAAPPVTPPPAPKNRRERRRLLQLHRSPGTDSSEAPNATTAAQRQPLSILVPPTKLSHSRSTPILRPTLPHARTTGAVGISVDPRVLQMRALANKLKLMFPEDAKCLSRLFSREMTSFDPRGRDPRAGERIIHVFVDHSNILIGLINHIKRRIRPIPKQKHISYAALALVLERGRPVGRRVLATSSPLIQPTDGAEAVGYEVHVYARVPDTGDGADRVRRTGHGKRASQGGGGAESGEGSSGGRASEGRPKGHKHAKSYSGSSAAGSAPSGTGGLHAIMGAKLASAANNAAAATAANGGTNGRVKYREQGVDELLQLKLHQAIAAAPDPLPRGSTIVLATGDGNVGQFNEEGFLGCVRTALKKGWRVELYAWEEGLSRSWKREFGREEQFVVVGLERFATELVESPAVVVA